MLPVAASASSYSFQTPLVNTITPGTNVTHVPYDNVAPSVSSAQVDNNTKGSAPPASSADQVATMPDAMDETSFALVQSGQAGASNAGVQATFVAQLAAQDASPEMQGVLAQYEKQIAISNVKYKPSNAFKPPVEPSSVFGRILESEKSTAEHVQATASQSAAEASSPITSEEAALATPVSEAHPVMRNAKAAPGSDETPEGGATDNTITIPTTLLPPKGINAYVATASRIATNNPLLGISQELA